MKKIREILFDTFWLVYAICIFSFIFAHAYDTCILFNNIKDIDGLENAIINLIILIGMPITNVLALLYYEDCIYKNKK